MRDPKGRLLIVDDDQRVAETTALIFTRVGYEVKVAYSAEQALELIQNWRPSAAILDLHLPKMDGIALARIIRSVYPDCRVALFSTQDITFSTMPLDDLPLMAKPVHPDTLLAFVGESIQPGPPSPRTPTKP